MDFYKETEKVKYNLESMVGKLSYERFTLCKDEESIQKRIAEIDKLIAETEAKHNQTVKALKDFSSFLAVKEGCVTPGQLKDAIEKGTNIEVPKK